MMISILSINMQYWHLHINTHMKFSITDRRHIDSLFAHLGSFAEHNITNSWCLVSRLTVACTSQYSFRMRTTAMRSLHGIHSGNVLLTEFTKPLPAFIEPVMAYFHKKLWVSSNLLLSFTSFSFDVCIK